MPPKDRVGCCSMPKPESTELKPEHRHHPGDVFKIKGPYSRGGWCGMYVVAMSVYPWGIQGHAPILIDHETPGCARVKIEWHNLQFIGKDQTWDVV